MFGKFSIGWRQVWVTALLMATSSMVTTTYGIIAVPLMQEFGPSRMVLMLTMTVISVVASSIAPWLGAMMDRVPLRRIMLTGAFFLVAGYFALSFVTVFWQVLAVFALFMAPAQLSAGTMASTVLLSRWFSAMRGKAIGLALTLIHLISIPVTNTSVNPARSTGVALWVGGDAMGQLWLFWLAPIVGALLAGWVQRQLLDGGRPTA